MESNEDRGWVKPVSDDSGAAQMEPLMPVGPARRSFLIGGVILAVVVGLAVTGSVIWRGLTGDPFGSARSVPTDMDFVISVDVLALSDSERLQSFVDAFGAPLFEAGLIDEPPGDVVEGIDRALGEEIGFTLADDILPWIGRSISIAGKVPDTPDPLQSFDSFQPSFLLSADVRDQTAAQVFVDKLQVSLSDNGVSPTAAMIAGSEGYRIDDVDEIGATALVLVDGALLVGTEADVVAAIKAREDGTSMAEDTAFLETMTRLPANQMVSFYVSAQAFESMAALGNTVALGLAQTPATSQADPLVASLGGSIGLVDEGLLMTYVALGDDTVVESGGPDLTVLETLPTETLGFMSIAGAQISGGTSLDSTAIDGLGSPFELFEDEFGIDLVAILESLSGDLTFAATETRDSAIARLADVPVGIVMSLGLNDPAPMADLIGTATEQLQGGGLSSVVDGTVTSFVDGDGEIVSYSLQDERLIIGTGPGLVGDVAAAQNGGLLAVDVYQDLDAALTGEGLIMFVDVGRIVRLIPMTSDEAAVLTPLRGIGVGTTSGNGGVVVEMLLLVDY